MLEKFENKWFNLECVSQRCLSLLNMIKALYPSGLSWVK